MSQAQALYSHLYRPEKLWHTVSKESKASIPLSAHISQHPWFWNHRCTIPRLMSYRLRLGLREIATTLLPNMFFKIPISKYFIFKSRRIVSLLTYQGTFNIIFGTPFWNVCRNFKLDFFPQPQSWIPKSRRVWLVLEQSDDNSELIPISHCIFFSGKHNFSRNLMSNHASVIREL